MIQTALSEVLTSSSATARHSVSPRLTPLSSVLGPRRRFAAAAADSQHNLVVLAASLDLPVSINTGSDSVKNTQLTKENKETERARSECFQGGGVRWTLVESEEALMQVEAPAEQLQDSQDDVII